MNYKIIAGVAITSIIIITIILSQYNTSIPVQQENSHKFFNFNINTNDIDLVELQIDSIFKISGIRGDYIIDGNTQKYFNAFFEFDEKISHSMIN